MDKKTMIRALILCTCGFVIFISLAIFVVMKNSEASDGVDSPKDGMVVSFSGTSQAPNESQTETKESRTSAENLPTPANDTFVCVKDYISDIRVDLRYSTEKNFTGQVIYDFDEAYLRYGTVKKLAAVQKELREQGMGLKIWDAFRPVEAQFKLWEIWPDAKYVSDPSKGYSSHSRGNTVDVTLVDSGGTEMVMPTGFDNFTLLADRDYSDVTDEFARDNAKLLESTMKKHGFEPYSGEWWHFSDSVEYDISKDFKP